MSDWNKLFTYTLLKRGKDLFDRKCVKEYEFKKDNGTYCCRVTDGSNKFRSSVTIKDGILENVYCSCAYHSTKVYCKHIAALLYKIESSGLDIKNSKELEKNVQPQKEFGKLVFHDDGEPHYLSFGTSLDVYRPSLSSLKKAEFIAKKQNGIYSREIEEENDKDGERVLHYRAKVNESYYSTAQVDIILSHDGIKKLTCEDARYSYIHSTLSETCSNTFRDSDGIIEICTHKTAALLDFISYLEKNRDIIDYTDNDAYEFISGFRKPPVDFRSIEDNQDKIDILPVLDDKNLRLYIKPGDRREYLVKDIDDLYDKCKEKNKYELGGGNRVNFKTALLTERAEKVMKLIEATGNYCYIFNRKDDEDYIYLYEDLPYTEVIDEFYNIMEGCRVRYRKEYLQGFRDGEPEVRIKIEEKKEDGRIVGVTLSGHITGQWKSEKYVYWVGDGYFNRAELSRIEPAYPLSAAADENGDFSFTIGLSLLDDFYMRVLPHLKQCAVIEDNTRESLSSLLTEEPQPRFYIDGTADEITCRTVFLYKGEEHQVYPRYGYYDGRVRNELPFLKSFGDDLDEALEDIFPHNYSENGYWVVRNREDDIYEFLRTGIKMLTQLGEVFVSDSIKRLNVRKMPKITGTIDIDENNSSILDMEIDLQGFTVDELSAILESYKEKKKYHRLENGDFISLKGADLDTLTTLFSASGVSLKDFVDGKTNIPLYRALYLEEVLKKQKGFTYEGGAKFRKLIEDFDDINKTDYAVPSSLENIMRPYQSDGYRWLKTLYEYGFGGILADEMGLGKTVQAISLMLSLKDEGKSVNALIITPASLVYNWRAEINRFAPSLNAAAVAGTAKERQEIIKNKDDYDILITSYDLLKRDILHYSGISFNLEVIDEAQYIKNSNTAAAKAVRAISSTHRIALTGTPIENRLSELWSIFNYLMPGFMFSQEKFKETISNPIEKSGDKDALERLKKLTGPFILRRLKTDVLKDLPEKIDETRITPLGGEQLKLYTAEVAKAKGMLKKSRNYDKEKIQILAELMKIRQICCDPSLVFKGYTGTSSKREAVMDLILSAIDGGHRILLFSQFTSMLELLEKDLDAKGISYYKITGETTKTKRMELVEAFNNDTTSLFLISLKAGGTGLNLTGADIVIHYDPWWNTAAQDQATDRAHRIGQTKTVTVFRMIAENTIEEKIMKLQETKKNLADKIVSSDNLSLSSLSKDDLMELLSISEM